MNRMTHRRRNISLPQTSFAYGNKRIYSGENISHSHTSLFLLIDSMESVSVRKKGRYEAHDKVDQYLLLQVCRHVQTDSLELLAEYLGVSEEQYVDTRTTQPANLRAQIMKVCKIETCFGVPSIFSESYIHKGFYLSLFSH